MLSLHQKQSLQQKLSPQQIQYQKLLQLNTLALEQRIKTELELNPILEEVMDAEEELSLDQKEDNDDEYDEEYDNKEDEFELEDFMNETDMDEVYINKSPGDDENQTQPIAPAHGTLTERLVEQLHLTDLSEEEIILGEEIIYNLDPDGYFRHDLQKIVDDLKMFEKIEISYERAEEILKLIQTFEPVGIAARDLQECLLVQIQNSSYDPYYSFIAEKILSEQYKNFINKRYDLIQKELKLTEHTLKSVIQIIQKLNPKPGAGKIELEQVNQITPDFIIEKINNNYIITLNDKHMPSVTISQTYLDMINTNKRKRKISKREKETHKFLREKFESAKWFIFSIQQRRETLLKIMRAIFEKQHEFFEHGPKALKPMIYKDIAEEVEMDISTISRVVNGKYVQSPQGIHELKYFFSEGLSTSDGEEVSNKHIKELIKEIIDNENKKSPYSDDKLAKILKEKGINIARRTVAKYREQLRIPVARLRKEL
ncbi:MAG: RNA polymerase sigma-54 factor [Ignavibacteria bacterium]|nr:MAG: RNA polymerase sigma-54 factor [Ignavibacteria bacterium]